MSETSVPELLGQLCDIHLGPVRRAYRVQPQAGRTDVKKELKKRAYNVLFSFLNNTLVKDESSNKKARNDYEGILLEIYKLRTKRRFEDADQLEILFNRLRKDDNEGSLEFLKFLVALKDMAGESASDVSEHDGLHFLKTKEINRKSACLPVSPVCYGDTRLLHGNSQNYMHYPKEVFEKPFPEIVRADEKVVFRAFSLVPGTGLGPDNIFINKFILHDFHEQAIHSSLFGGLIQGRAKGLDIHLSLPDLSSDFNIRIPDFKSRKSPTSSRMSDESGLGSGSASMSSSVITLPESSVFDTSLWERALTEPRSEHYTWEWIGYLPGRTERPYLTEAGPGVFDVLIQLRQRVLAIMCQEPQAVPLVSVQADVLVKYIQLMLTGVSSKLFPYNQETRSFGVLDGLHISGTSPEMLASFLQEFVECGTSFARVASFSQPPVLNSFYTGGLIFQAFSGAIRKFLSHYTAAILKVSPNLPLLRLKVYMLRSMEQMRYVAKLCRCHDKLLSVDVPSDFPTGMKLLSYLYDEAEMSSSSVHYPLLLSILQSSYSPFILFIRDWIFHGVYRDYYEEFMIQVDLSCLESRDETYWSRAYTLMSEGDRSRVPQFLRDSIHDVVTCGKSINLLRVCHPEHFICNVSESDIPSLSITFSRQDLKTKEKACQTYLGKMKQMALQRDDDRQETLRKIEQQRTELQQMARRVAESEIARLQGILDERKKKEKAKKQTEFDRLKKQMETDLTKRAEDTEQAKEADRQYIARLNHEEHTLAEKEIELEKKARDELIAYYTELGEEAMHRERLALWRVRRAKLGNHRLLFLEKDAERWKHEMDERQQAKSVLDSATENLPSWTAKSAQEGVTVHIPREEEALLPSWTRQKLSAQNDDAGLGCAENGIALPKWAERGLESLKAETLEVTDELESSSESGESSSESGDTERGSMHEQGEGNDRNLCEHLAVLTDGQTIPESVEKLPESVDIAGRLHRAGRRNATEESEEFMAARSTVKMVQGVGAHTETEEGKEIRHTKGSTTMTATKESSPDTGQQKPHVRFVESLHVNRQSSQERDIIPKLGKNPKLQSVSNETAPQVWTIKKPSLFGHVSQLSNAEYLLTLPKLRRQNNKHANMESSFKDFAIKPCIRMSKTMSSSKESEIASVTQRPKTQIRVLPHRNASTESQWVDAQAVAVRRFKARNVWGHSSDSTVQKLLYGDPESQQWDKTDGPLPRVEIKPGLPYQAESYHREFEGLDKGPMLDLMSHVFVADLGQDLMDTAMMSQEEVEAYKYMPLSVLLARSVTAPIRAQTSLVNNAVINYFTSELKVDSHFEAIRRYLLMADGDFAEILANILLEKMSTNPLPQEILNPVFLNGALNKAIRSSIHSDDENAQNLSFALRHMPAVFLPNAPTSLNCLELRYHVMWPLSIILTSACMEKYYKIFSFLLQIKRIVWTLKDIWHRLKRDALINKAGNVTQFRHLQLHRQEMEHFVKMTQGYITSQVIHVSWQEFQTALTHPISDLYQLHALHERYVDKVISRCLLDKKAERVMKIIQDIFCLILKFRSQLVSGGWQRSGARDEISHPNFSNMVNTYKSFHVYSFFLFKVVKRLSEKGYQPHLQELLLQLNFSDYYTEAAS